MARLLTPLRLSVLAVLAIFLTFRLVAAPGTLTYQLPGGAGTIAVPRSLEGWHLEAGNGDLLVWGYTRFRLMQLDVEKTPIVLGQDLDAYIGERHARLFRSLENYKIVLTGQQRPFGPNLAPTSRAVFTGALFGIPLRMVQQDVYWKLNGRYVRIGMCFPEVLDGYFQADQYFIAEHVKMAE